MKITKEYLRTIIVEELGRLNEADSVISLSKEDQDLYNATKMDFITALSKNDKNTLDNLKTKLGNNFYKIQSKLKQEYPNIAKNL